MHSTTVKLMQHACCIVDIGICCDTHGLGVDINARTSYQRCQIPHKAQSSGARTKHCRQRLVKQLCQRVCCRVQARCRRSKCSLQLLAVLNLQNWCRDRQSNADAHESHAIKLANRRKISQQMQACVIFHSFRVCRQDILLIYALQRLLHDVCAPGPTASAQWRRQCGWYSRGWQPTPASATPQCPLPAQPPIG